MTKLERHNYDGAKLSFLGFGDTGAETVEMDWMDVVRLAESVAGETDTPLSALCEQIESTRID